MYLGGTVRRVRAEYASEDDVENGETVDLGEAVTGQNYDIELVWRSGGLFVYIDRSFVMTALFHAPRRWLHTLILMPG